MARFNLHESEVTILNCIPVDIRLKVGELDGIDILLRALSVSEMNYFIAFQVLKHGTQAYRKKDAGSEDESEMVENLFNSMCSLLNENENRVRFLEAEGIELMVIMLK